MHMHPEIKHLKLMEQLTTMIAGSFLKFQENLTNEHLPESAQEYPKSTPHGRPGSPERDMLGRLRVG